MVLGVVRDPDVLAAGLLVGVNPLSGLYASMFGTVTGSSVTSSPFMAVQATGVRLAPSIPHVTSTSSPTSTT